MVNLDFNKFKKEQQEHQGVYIGGTNRQHGPNQQPGVNDPEYNNQEDTDKAPGATGRSVNGQIK